MTNKTNPNSNKAGLESSASNSQNQTSGNAHGNTHSELMRDIADNLRDNPRVVEEPDEGTGGDIPTILVLLREILSLQRSQRLLEKEELVVAYRPNGYIGTDLRPIVDSDSVSANADSAMTELMGNLISNRLEIIVDKLERIGVTVPSELVFTTTDD